MIHGWGISMLKKLAVISVAAAVWIGAAYFLLNRPGKSSEPVHTASIPKPPQPETARLVAPVTSATDEIAGVLEGPVAKSRLPASAQRPQPSKARTAQPADGNLLSIPMPRPRPERQ
jgi:hypothetical protein